MPAASNRKSRPVSGTDGVHDHPGVRRVAEEMEFRRDVGILNQSMKCVVPVSYTHLDVYKRQVLDDGVDLGDFTAIVHEDVRHFRAIAEHEYDEKNRETE